MLNAKQIVDEGLLLLENTQGKPAQVGYDITLKAVQKVGFPNTTSNNADYKIGKVLKDKTELTTYTPFESINLDGVEGWLLHEGVYDITFKLLTHGDEQKIEAEIKGLQKINPNVTTDVTTRLKYMVTSVEGKRDAKDIRDFVDNYLIAKDSRALRQYYAKVSPDINLKYIPEDVDYVGEGIDIPISVNFFWPDSGI